MRLMFKDFSFILQEAVDLSVALPATAAAAQVAAVEHARETALHCETRPRQCHSAIGDMGGAGDLTPVRAGSVVLPMIDNSIAAARAAGARILLP